MNDWHLDKRVPITLIVSIVLQTCALVWFLSKQDSRIANVEERSFRLEREVSDDRKTVAQNAQGVAVINQALTDIKNSLDRIEREVIENRKASQK